jgi:cell division septum initiation protein DivIVA
MENELHSYIQLLERTLEQITTKNLKLEIENKKLKENIENLNKKILKKNKIIKNLEIL